VIGFALSLGNSTATALWMTGDTVLHRPLRRIATQLRADVLLMHLGSVRFPLTGTTRYSMDASDAITLIGLAEPRVAVPVHYEGWSHFSEPQDRLHAALDGAPPPVRTAVRWLRPGVAQTL
jgi:L-ascorbate metabolism protein UlaG (beta-lactamase superfamily)